MSGFRVQGLNPDFKKNSMAKRALCHKTTQNQKLLPII
jgi:hypothetical protein